MPNELDQWIPRRVPKANQAAIATLDAGKADNADVSAVMAVANTKASITAMNQRALASRKINGYDLTVDRNLTAADVGAATPTDVATAISNLVDSAPGALNTLREIDNALGNDPNLAGTLTASIATKADAGTTTTALATKADKSVTVNGQPLSGNVSITPSTLGLPNVANLAPASYPVSTAQQAALDLKADTTALTTGLAGKVPTTRTVAGKALSSDVALVKGDVGLSLVDNTADSAKPVSTAQQTALDGKTDTAYVDGRITDLINAAPAGLDTLGELAVLAQSLQASVDAKSDTSYVDNAVAVVDDALAALTAEITVSTDATTASLELKADATVTDDLQQKYDELNDNFLRLLKWCIATFDEVPDGLEEQVESALEVE